MPPGIKRYGTYGFILLGNVAQLLNWLVNCQGTTGDVTAGVRRARHRAERPPGRVNESRS
jgi:hypothetical protein